VTKKKKLKLNKRTVKNLEIKLKELSSALTGAAFEDPSNGSSC
jgi:hypothetical protein